MHAETAAPATAPTHEPYVPASRTDMPEFTWQAIIAGAVLGIIFGMSSLYLVLKAGLTVSASIPVAVISITLFRAFSKAFGLRRTTILENNIVQTAGSAGESIAFGIGVTMPALLMLGFEMELSRVMLVAVLGGLLGILMMIPLRRVLIVRLHGRPGEPGKLVYPEGTACAEVLKTGERGGTSGVIVLLGFAVAFVHQFMSEAMSLLRTGLEYPLHFFSKRAELSTETSMALLGVGYIIGIRTAAIMMAGAVMGYLVIIPTIYTFGEQLETTLAPASRGLIRDMSTAQLRSNYLLYIGAGCVAAAGIISMFKMLPMIIRSISAGLHSLREEGDAARAGGALPRTERDMSLRVTLLGSLALVACIALYLLRDVPPLTAVLGGVLIILFGFLFVMVSSRLTGEIGSSSNPISGMTIATLLLTCLILLSLNMTSRGDLVLALTIGGIVCVAASNGGTTSQDLKTGFLVGGTPRLQQFAIIIGAVSSALCMGYVLKVFNQSGTIYSEKHAPAVNVQNHLPQLTETETYQGKSYHVLRVTSANQENYTGIDPGKYLVEDTGKIRYLVDPAVTGRLTEHDDGRKATMKFEAPKTQVMALVVNGVLGQRMNWGLVLLGAMIAITLELCGVASLPFAVGVYVPMGVSAPIFIGGLTRWAAERLARGRRSSVPGHSPAAIASAESSPGVLLASGLVAGATLAGVVYAFINLSENAPARINLSDEMQKVWGDSQWPTVLFFAGLVAVLFLVGWGKLFRDRGAARREN
jgi:putative OPT family oligopeptide transporter